SSPAGSRTSRGSLRAAATCTGSPSRRVSTHRGRRTAGTWPSPRHGTATMRSTHRRGRDARAPADRRQRLRHVSGVVARRRVDRLREHGRQHQPGDPRHADGRDRGPPTDEGCGRGPVPCLESGRTARVDARRNDRRRRAPRRVADRRGARPVPRMAPLTEDQADRQGSDAVGAGSYACGRDGRTGRSKAMKWVTREHPRTDRVACPWLIRTFIDPDAEIVYVPPDDVLAFAQREGATSFDAPGAKYTHRGPLCSFET